jgi:hypothetical protein
MKLLARMAEIAKSKAKNLVYVLCKASALQFSLRLLYLKAYKLKMISTESYNLVVIIVVKWCTLVSNMYISASADISWGK